MAKFSAQCVQRVLTGSVHTNRHLYRLREVTCHAGNYMQQYRHEYSILTCIEIMLFVRIFRWLRIYLLILTMCPATLRFLIDCMNSRAQTAGATTLVSSVLR